MNTWQKMITIAVAITAVIIAGTVVYLQYFSRRTLLIATTTSLWETDLLKEIERVFEAKYPVDIQFTPQGTGPSLELAKKGDADGVLVHSPSQEKTFLTGGFGVSRKIIAYNFFTIVGPQNDPAGITGSNVTEAFKKIAEYGRNRTATNPSIKVWFSRGDNSGTHSKEQSLWNVANFNYTVVSTESWYASAGSGMGETLLKTDQKSAYTLSDIGTFLKFSKEGTISLKALIGEKQELLNAYSVIAVNQTLHKHRNFEDMIAFIKFLISDECQQLIEDFGKNDYGQSGRLFHAAVQLIKQQNSTEQIVQWIKDYAMKPFGGSECPPEYRDARHPEIYS